MIFVVDANIIFSAILNTNSRIGDLLVNSKDIFTFIAPEFLRAEIKEKHSKIIQIAGYSTDQLQEIVYQVFKNLVFISEEQVPIKIWKDAYDMVQDIDEKDTPYIAYSIYFKCDLWTGDKQLMIGLKKKGYNKIVNTEHLIKLKEKKMES